MQSNSSSFRFLALLALVLFYSSGLFGFDKNGGKPIKNNNLNLVTPADSQSRLFSQGEIGSLGQLSEKVDAKIAAVKEYHLPLLPRLTRAKVAQEQIVAELQKGKSPKAGQEVNIGQIKRAIEQVNPKQPKAAEVKALLVEAGVYQDKALRWMHRPKLAGPRGLKAQVKIEEAIKLLEAEKKKEQDKKDKQKQDQDQKKKDSKKSDQDKKEGEKSDKKDQNQKKEKQKEDKESQKNKDKKTKPETKEALEKLKQIQENQKAEKKRRRKALGLPAERPKEAVDQDW